MHRATPVGSSFRAHTAGGAGSVVDSVDDNNLMQEMKGNFMKGETRSKVEAPQNYGFSSVTADADKPEAKKDGSGAAAGEGQGGGMGAEAYINFAGGNRSFATATVIDDRRHRLKGLAKGDTALFGQREWGQQFHLNKDGMWMSGNEEKKIKMQLVKNEQEDERQSEGSAAGGGGGQQQNGQKQAKGQKQLYDKQSDKSIEMDGKNVTARHGEMYSSQRSGSDSSLYYQDRKKSSQTTDKHVHMRFEQNRIWVDSDGHWSESPILQKKDGHCKE